MTSDFEAILESLSMKRAFTYEPPKKLIVNHSHHRAMVEWDLWNDDYYRCLCWDSPSYNELMTVMGQLSELRFQIKKKPDCEFRSQLF